jgi:hypothetical protein
MTFARNPSVERAGEAGWPWSHRQIFLERLGTQGYAPYTLGEYRSIAGRFCDAIEKRAVGVGDLNEKRFAREGICEAAPFGSAVYSKEELCVRKWEPLIFAPRRNFNRCP